MQNFQFIWSNTIYRDKIPGWLLIFLMISGQPVNYYWQNIRRSNMELNDFMEIIKGIVDPNVKTVFLKFKSQFRIDFPINFSPIFEGNFQPPFFGFR